MLAAVGLTAATSGAMPSVGTYLEPWYTSRSAYHWPVAAAHPDAAAGRGSESIPGSSVTLFADVNADGKDDLIRAGVSAGNCTDGKAWTVSLSNGVDGWSSPLVWWCPDGPGPGGAAERFAMDMDGDGAADACVFDEATVTWTVALANRKEEKFATAAVFDGHQFGCGGAQFRSASAGFLWCVEENDVSSERDALVLHWGGLDFQSKSMAAATLSLSGATRPAARVWAARTTNTSKRRGDAVVVDASGNVFIAISRNDPGGAASFGPARIALANFTAARGAPCAPGGLMLVPYTSAVFGAVKPPTAVLACADSVSGYWYAGPLGYGVHASVAVWKYSHGGLVHGLPGPRPQGWPGAGLTEVFSYRGFYVADPWGSGSPVPLACNLTHQGHGWYTSPRCLVMPPDNSKYFDKGGYEAHAPTLKSTNVNLWQAWHMSYLPLLHSHDFGGYDSADLVQARFMFDKLTEVGVNFYISDNTNGLGCDFGNTIAATKTLAAFCARYNAEPAHRSESSKMYYSLSVGVNPLGPPTAAATLQKMDAQLLSVWDSFLNASEAATKAIDGNSGHNAASAAALSAAAYRHPVSKRPLAVLYVEPSFEPLYTAYLAENKSGVGNRFHIGYSDGNNWRPGLYGWMIDRSCGPPNTPDKPCTETGPDGPDVGVRSDKDTMYISPAYGKSEPALPPATKPYHAYAARDITWYRQGFEAVATQCPTVMIVGAFNDYTENNAWWPSECPSCRTGEENDPYLFWNATVHGMSTVREKCAGTDP